ncbi:MAG: response regulator [ANME-2 cluster archaeon]|nr:MAG: response regulator [ANME-2 cluster archaeon]
MFKNMDHLLVVDDDKSVRDVLKDALEYYGYKVTIASNGQEGLEYFNNSHNFKLVITDIKMPIMDGIELARSIRNSTKPDIPIIAITGFFVDKNIERDLFNSIIGKPFDLASLAKVISQLLES